MKPFTVILLIAALTGCETKPQRTVEQPQKPADETPERLAYRRAVDEYNDLLNNPEHHKYQTTLFKGDDRNKEEACYLIANVISAVLRDPEFTNDANGHPIASTEIARWRVIWRDDWKCDPFLDGQQP